MGNCFIDIISDFNILAKVLHAKYITKIQTLQYCPKNYIIIPKLIIDYFEL